ncbi:MAG: two-component system response regulator LytT, partial [Psychroserpens sp.]
YVNIDRRLIKIDIPSIYLVEAKGDYIQVKTENQNYTVHSTLKKIEDKLPKDLFLKIHRSFIINVDKIIDIEDNSVLIKKDVIPVSRSNRPELMKRLNLL